jgi:hypothetical protein
VSTAGGSLNVNALSLIVNVKEKTPDLPAATAAAGNINFAGLTVTLTPLVGGGTITLSSCTSVVTGTDYSGVKAFTCKNSVALPVNTYEVSASVTGNYYVGSDVDSFTVYDPSLGFATGGGTFSFGGDRVNFGFTMKYNKSWTNLQGSLLVIRHHADGTISRIKSNSLGGLAIQDIGGCGIATFTGKSTYTAWNGGVGGYVTSGGNAFTVYAEDCNNPGSGVDSIWINGAGNLAMPSPAALNKKPLTGGNIVVPHTPGKK